MTNSITKNALVLAGGGVAGIAWETGVLLGIQDEHPQLSEQILNPSTTLVGTSAGSTVAAQIAGGGSLQRMFDRHLEDDTAEILVEIDLVEFGGMMADAMQAANSPEDARRRLGDIALAADTPSVALRRKVIEARLLGVDWTDWPLKITAIHTGTGQLRVFERSSGVSLVDVVSASCAVPGIWPSVEIDGDFYMDGGMRTVANSDLAAGAEQILILVPSPAVSRMGQSISDAELAALESSRIHVVFADDASIEAMGLNPLDPESRKPAAIAGRELGRLIASEVAEFWR